MYRGFHKRGEHLKGGINFEGGSPTPLHTMDLNSRVLPPCRTLQYFSETLQVFFGTLQVFSGLQVFSRTLQVFSGKLQDFFRLKVYDST